MAMTEKNGPERFCKEIGKHFVRGTVDDGNALGLETVLHEEITNVDVARLLPAGCSTILLKSDSALVILIKIFSVSSYPRSAKNILAQIVLGR